ncbi:GNAT family N-acetyltransferase [Georgenia ruanii]|uniref:GNAT family N-acetyltransferase n=1 Tax=Georgenia ruanii TaxID=348442 RepID=A0A7J9UUI6_9MICO|nr:GNAT family N-acetyltransferase [Georgenia ruanii]MPV88278.1 GNAT family N-acetyltransferase [Georgenia ruanii]
MTLTDPAAEHEMRHAGDGAAALALHRLDRRDLATLAWRAAAVALRPLAAQERFSSRAELTLPEADREPHRTAFVVARGAAAVGYGVLDAVGYLDQLTDRPREAALLRAFYIDHAQQRRGYGRAAVRLLPDLVREVVPAARWLYLTVNEKNPAAVRAYAAAGLEDVGRYLGGSHGPQRVMRMAVR